jgi:hypothetical protein
VLLAAGLVLLICAPPAEADCAIRPRPAILNIQQALVGFPVEVKTAAGYPGCDVPGDSITSVIAWGDGSSSATTAGVPDGASWGGSVSHSYLTHSYLTAGSYPVVVSSFNARTGITTTDSSLQASVSEPRFDTGTRTMPKRLRWRTGVRFSGSVVQIRVADALPVLQRYRSRIEWGDDTVGNGTVTIRGAVLSVTARHTWRKPLRRGRIVVTVTDAATHGTLTIRRAVRIA